MRSNKNIRKTRSRTHGDDRKARPITNHDGRRTRGVWGRTEERIPASEAVWKEAPESAIHSVLTGGVRPVALKARSAAGWVERAGSRTARTGEQQRRAWLPVGAEDETPPDPETPTLGCALAMGH